MIMNYVLSFCKITAASRIFSRNFYLPLLKPLTPKDALRTLKITGKWLLGSKIHHYIPVLFNHKKKRSKRLKDYGKVAHRVDDSYTYMAPRIDSQNEAHRLLSEVLDGKVSEEFFVYTVEDKMYNLVFPGKLELAIRDGDIVDVLISQSNDKILLKMKDFKKVSLELEFYDEKRALLRGEGATGIEEEKFHHHGKLTMSLAKIFEAKELAEEWEMEMMKIVAKKKKQKAEGSKEWNEMVEGIVENLDWEKFEVEAKKVIDQILEPAEEDFIGMEVEDLERTKDVEEFVVKGGFLGLLPSLSEIPEVVKSMATAIYEELEQESKKLTGVTVLLASGKKCFIVGQMVKTEEGEFFVPGQTIQNEFGLSYAPGITVNLDQKPHLVKGLIMAEDQQKPMFMPTESSITKDGQLTFCRNPKEKSKATPKKLLKIKKNLKKNKKKKTKKSTNQESQASLHTPNQNFDQTTIPQASDLINNETIAALDLICTEPNQDSIEETDLLNSELIDVPSNIELDYAENTSLMPSPSEGFSEATDLDLIELDYEEKLYTDSDSNLETSPTGSDDRDFYKPLDDGMEKLIDSLQDKKSALQAKLEALRKIKIKLDNAVTYVNLKDVEDLVSKLVIDEENYYRLSELLLNFTRRCSTYRERNSLKLENIKRKSSIDTKFGGFGEELRVVLKSAAFASNEILKRRPKDQQLCLKTIWEIVEDSLRNVKALEELCENSKTGFDREEVVNAIFKELSQELVEEKVEVLKRGVELAEDGVDGEELVVLVEKVLKGDVVGEAFGKLVKGNLEVVNKVFASVKGRLEFVKSESEAVNVLRKAIAEVVEEFCEENLEDFDETASQDEVEEFVKQAKSLSQVLSLYDVEEHLEKLISDPDLSLVDAGKCTVEFLKRFCLIKKITERDFSLKSALNRLQKHPESAQKDPNFKHLLRLTASLISKQRPLRNSREIPLIFFETQNFLAIEDYVNLKSQISSPLLICRKGVQTVVPAEASRKVLGGAVEYVVVDEGGLSAVKPLHLFKTNDRRKQVKMSLALDRMSA